MKIAAILVFIIVASELAGSALSISIWAYLACSTMAILACIPILRATK